MSLREALAIAREFADIVHNTVQIPLDVHFGFAPQYEAQQANIVLEVTEHGLDDTEAHPVDQPPAPGIDLVLDLGSERLGRGPRSGKRSVGAAC